MLKDLKIENIYIVCGHTDMRKSIDGLASIIQQQFQLANWVIKGAKWFEPVIRQLWAYAYLEPVLNADETPTRVLKKDGKPTRKKGQMWIVCTGASAARKIALYPRNGQEKWSGCVWISALSHDCAS